MDKIMGPGLYNMDCMEAMKQFPDGFFDLAIVDPPYGGGFRQDDDTATSLRGGGYELGAAEAGTLRRDLQQVPHRDGLRGGGADWHGERGRFGQRFDRYHIGTARPCGGGTDWQRKERGRWGQRFERYHIGNPDGRNLGDEVPGPTKGGGITHWDVAPPPEYFNELARVSRAQIIWGGNYFDLPPTRCFVVWDKGIPEKFTMAMCEYAWTSFNANAKLFHYLPQGKKGEE